jgi:hypothetical protein
MSGRRAAARRYSSTEIALWQGAAMTLPLPEVQDMATGSMEGLADILNAFNQTCNQAYLDEDLADDALAAAVASVARQATAAAIFALGVRHRTRRSFVGAIAVKAGPVQVFAVQEIHRQPGHTPGWRRAVGAGVDCDKGGHVHGEGQAHIRIIQRPGWFDSLHVVAGREAVACRCEHPGPFGLVREGFQEVRRCPGLVVGQRCAHRRPAIG